MIVETFTVISLGFGCEAEATIGDLSSEYGYESEEFIELKDCADSLLVPGVLLPKLLPLL